MSLKRISQTAKNQKIAYTKMKIYAWKKKLKIIKAYFGILTTFIDS